MRRRPDPTSAHLRGVARLEALSSKDRDAYYEMLGRVRDWLEENAQHVEITDLENLAAGLREFEGVIPLEDEEDEDAV
jgi:hypothetical protein